MLMGSCIWVLGVCCWVFFGTAVGLEFKKGLSWFIVLISKGFCSKCISVFGIEPTLDLSLGILSF